MRAFESRGKKPPSDIALWVVLSASALSAGWLLPNHQPPWFAFHTDAWVATASLLLCCMAAFRFNARICWHQPAILALCLSPIPFLQYHLGLLNFAGEAWMASLYLGGFLIAMIGGQQWERWRSGALGDIFFLAVGIAGLISVGLQIHQWLLMLAGDETTVSIWTHPLNGVRPYANLAQPNQLATLLVWGFLSVLWALSRRYIRLSSAYLLSIYLMVGLSLTQSRTGALALFFIFALSFLWRRLWPVKGFSIFITGTATAFVLINLGLDWLSDHFVSGVSSGVAGRVNEGGGIRLDAWRMFLDAATAQPWLGYGWGSALPAQLSVIKDHPSLYGVPFSQTHNLILDLIIWIGFPIGVMTSALITTWLMKGLFQLGTAKEAVLMMVLLAAFLHSMLEFPLHYAYFLLPTGLVTGILCTSLKLTPVFTTNRWPLAVAILVSGALFGLVVRDYLEIEEDLYRLKFEQRNIGTPAPGAVRSPLVLNHLGEFIATARLKPNTEMSVQEIDRLRKTATVFPTFSTMFNLAAALGLNAHTAESEMWSLRLCAMTSESACTLGQQSWTQLQREHPQLSTIEWPVGLYTAK